MRVRDLIHQAEGFLFALIEHGDLYSRAAAGVLVDDYPAEHREELREQSRQLVPVLRKLRPFFERFNSGSSFVDSTSGAVADTLDIAVRMENDVQTKSSALKQAVEIVEQIIRSLQSFNLDDEIPRDPGTPVRPGRVDTARMLIPNTRRVLVIHGHDDANVLRLKDLLKMRGFEPIILRQEPAKGRTLIEKFEQVAETCAFAFALMTPDDQVRVRTAKSDIRSYFDDPGIQLMRQTGDEYAQARPNVIFEIGWM